ncbi:MAG: hypothetical protein U5Q03_12555 [Bacteroidota bacterium]|nr:hypothetical protein [Bacteroidota bacterium]
MKIKISRGATFQGNSSTAGMIILIGGILLIIYTDLIIFSLLSISIGLILFLKVNGLIIDTQEKRYKPYLDLLLFKYGKWHELAPYDQLTLKLFNESQTMNMVSISNTHTIRTYDVCLRGNKVPDILLKDFVEYENARKFLNTVAEKLQMKTFDAYAEFLKKRK